MSSTGTKEFDKKIEELQNLPTKDEQIDRVNELESEAFGHYGILPFANGPQMVGVKKGAGQLWRQRLRHPPQGRYRLGEVKALKASSALR